MLVELYEKHALPRVVCVPPEQCHPSLKASPVLLEICKDPASLDTQVSPACPSDNRNIIWSNGGMIGQKRRGRGKTCPSVIQPTTQLKRNDLGSNSGLRGDRPEGWFGLLSELSLTPVHK
jgi:hypothetical protein